MKWKEVTAVSRWLLSSGLCNVAIIRICKNLLKSIFKKEMNKIFHFQIEINEYKEKLKLNWNKWFFEIIGFLW